MENELIKLKVKGTAAEGSDSHYIITKFVEACEKLDASIFEPLIEEDQYFQDLDKFRFLQSLKDEFIKVKSKGIKKTILKKGKCMGCQNGNETHQFYGDSVDCEFSYLIQTNDGVLQDIFICNFSSGSYPGILERHRQNRKNNI